jgi:hypothetical protein
LKIKLTTQDLAAIAVCSALYAVFGWATSGISFFGIGFLPAVVIPAVFAVLYGPWVGGISGAIGIFIRDMFVHGNPALSLAAGVPPNFILFFLIGYLSIKNISLKQALICVSLAIAGLLVPSIIFLPEMAAFNTFSYGAFLLTFVLTIVVSLATIAVVSIRWKEWRSYAIGTVVGQLAGCFLLSVTLWLVSPLFLEILELEARLAAIYILPLFVWTIATEIPFILIAGPPIIKAVQKAFPTLQYRRNNSSKKGGHIVDQKSR